MTMKRILATTAIVALTALPLAAETQGMALDDAAYTTTEGHQIRVSNLMGKTVYIQREGAEQTDWSMQWSDAPDTWENVAEVDDILIGPNGQIAYVILDAGGFLGMGEREVRIPLSDLRMVPDADAPDEFFAVYTGDRQLIEQSEDYDQTMARDEGYRSARDYDATDHAAMDKPTADPATGNQAATDGAAARAPMLDRSTMKEVVADEVTVDQLEGARVYGSNDEWIGDVDEMIVSSDGRIEKVIVDVGGFLGIGEKPVALNFNEIRFLRTDGGDDLTAYVDMTEDQMKSLGEWKGASN